MAGVEPSELIRRLLLLMLGKSPKVRYTYRGKKHVRWSTPAFGTGE